MSKVDDLYKKLYDLVTSEDLDDYVHDLKSKEASAINNGGFDEQFDYLYGELGSRGIEDIIKEFSK